MAGLGAWLLLDPGTPLVHLAIYAAILSTSSVGIVVPMIQEKGIASDIYGQTILSAALLVDFFAMIAISALAGIVVSGSAQGALGSLALVAIAVPAIRLLPRPLAREIGRAP